MNRRFDDIPIYTFSSWSNTLVVCPKCGKAGVVSFDEISKIAYFRCSSCFAQKDMNMSETNTFEIRGHCTSTNKYFRQFISKDKIKGKKQKVKCPYCDEYVIAEITRKRDDQMILYKNNQEACDPYFHYAMYYQMHFRGKTIWAYNEEHLEYLIEYLSADLRTVHYNFHKTHKTMRTQSDCLPTFFKIKKNRDGIVKVLIKLRDKR